MTRTEKNESTILKVSAELGLIFGFAAICKVDGEDFIDGDNEYYPEESMLADSTEFAKSARVGCVMHQRDENGNPVNIGAVVHTFPLTTEIAKALDIETRRTGLLIAMAPEDPDILEKAASGEYAGFSIGGEILDSEYED